MPVTIDNLGPGPSERYAKDQSLIDSSKIKGALPLSSQQTQIDVSSPSFPGELDTLLDMQPTHSAWALFNPPPLYLEQRKRLFSFQIIPSIGPEEKWELHTQKVLEQLRTQDREEKKKKQGQDLQNEEEKKKKASQDLTDREKKILINLITTMRSLNKLLIEIYGKKSQYHKG